MMWRIIDLPLVSLSPFLSKILVKVVFKQVSDFLSQNNLLHAKQSGFESGHSTGHLFKVIDLKAGQRGGFDGLKLLCTEPN